MMTEEQKQMVHILEKLSAEDKIGLINFLRALRGSADNLAPRSFSQETSL